MTRFNFLGRDRIGEITEMLLLVRVPGVRGPFIVAAASLLLLGFLQALEDWRVSHAAAHLANLVDRDAQMSATREKLHLMSRNVAHLLEIQAYVRGVRQSGFNRAVEIAFIGNCLPSHVWLTTLRYVETGWVLTGGAQQVSDVGSAMLALNKLPDITSTTLVAAHSTERGGEGVQYEIRLGRRR